MQNELLSIVIPSKNERFLKRTIEDVLEKSVTDIEVFPVLDGYTIPDEEVVNDPRVHYIHLPETSRSKKRDAINFCINEKSSGKYVCWLDAHIMLSHGWDEVLRNNSKANRVQIMRRYRLDPFNWCTQKQDRKLDFIDYEHLLWKGLEKHEMHGFRSEEITRERQNLIEDDVLTCQGSFFFMERSWFTKMGFMDMGYQGQGEESEEIVFGTVYAGGEVKVRKDCWYAHLHKSEHNGGRGFHKSRSEAQSSYDYAWKKLVTENTEKFIEHIEKFPLDPNYPKNWKEIIIK